MPRKSKGEGEHENLERWLLTYADLITLLLAFFIVMYSMSKIDAKKFGQMTEALNTILRGRGTSVLKGQANFTNLDGGGGAMKIGDLMVIQEKINKMAAERGLGDKIKASMEKRGLIIHISESAFFDLGSADLKPQALDVLNIITDMLLEIPNDVRVEGHTDNTPIKYGKRYPSNWELSVTRATNCVRYMIDSRKFPPMKISALGYSEYRPIATNDTEVGRSRNRRVDIVVLSWDSKKDEPSASPEDISQIPEKNSNSKDSTSKATD